MKGVWLLPTLNRPQLLKEFFDAFREANGSTDGLLLIDNEDYLKNLEAYEALVLPPGWGIYKTKAVSMGDKVREAWDLYKDLDWVGILNDDHRPRTLNFDTKILAHLTSSNIIGTNDGPTLDKPWQAPNRLCGGIVFSGPVIRALGYFFPPGIQHLYSDNAWELLGANAGCIQILMDVCVEHDHVYKHKKEDETSRKVNDPKSWEGDKAAFDDFVKNRLPKDAEKLMSLQPKQGLMIATPFQDSRCFNGYAFGLAQTQVACTMNRLHCNIARVDGSSLLPHARNSLVDMFLKSKCQKLLFIDSDQGFNDQHVFMLLQSNKRIIGGITPHKRYPINYNFEPLDIDNKYFKELTNKGNEEMAVFQKERADQKGEIEVSRVGTGFLMIDRSVFEIMKDHVSTYRPFDNNQEAIHYEFFKMGVTEEAGRYRGEDWFFTEKCKELGIPIYINTNCVVQHHGSQIW